MTLQALRSMHNRHQQEFKNAVEQFFQELDVDMTQRELNAWKNRLLAIPRKTSESRDVSKYNDVTEHMTVEIWVVDNPENRFETPGWLTRKQDKKQSSRIPAFEHMIENDLEKYECDSWSNPGPQNHYARLGDLEGKVQYRGHEFIIHRSPSVFGRGGMDMGSPESATIYKVR